MADAVIDDWEQFTAFLAAQPLCRWAAHKQQDLAAGRDSGAKSRGIHTPEKKADNAELAAALASMA